MRKPLKKNKQLQLKLWLMMPPGERLYTALFYNTHLKRFWSSTKAKELMNTYIIAQQKKA